MCICILFAGVLGDLWSSLDHSREIYLSQVKVSALLHLASLILHILKSRLCFVHTKEFVFNTEIIGIDDIMF